MDAVITSILAVVILINQQGMYAADESANVAPSSQGVQCSYDEDSLRDVMKALRMARDLEDIAEDEVIWRKYTLAKHGECKFLVNQILQSTNNIVELLLEKEDLEAIEQKYQEVLQEVGTFKSLLDPQLLPQENKIKDGTDELLQHITQIRMEKEQMIKEQREATVRHILNFLKISDFNEVVKAIEGVQDKSTVAEEVVKAALDKGFNVKDVVAFATRTGDYNSSFVAMSKFYNYMKNGKLQDFSILSIYLHLQGGIKSKELTGDVKSEWHRLLNEVKPHATTILQSLAYDVAALRFEQPQVAFRSTLKSLHSDALIGELVSLNSLHHSTNVPYITDFPYFQFYLPRNFISSSNLPFEKLFKFLTTMQNGCHAVRAAWAHLKATNRGETFEALQLWLWAKYQLLLSQHDSLTNVNGCGELVFAVAPAHYDMLVFEYIENRGSERMKALHRDFPEGMRLIMRDAIKRLSKVQVTEAGDLWQWSSAIGALASLADKCWALEAMSYTMARHGERSNFPYFKFLLRLKHVLAKSNYGSLLGIHADKCKRVNADMPAPFKTLIHDSTSRCRLINFHYNEPLYVASSGKDWNVYLWIDEDVDEDQYWVVNVDSNAEVTLRNPHRDDRYVIVRGKDNRLDSKDTGQRDYFKPYASSDGSYLVLKAANSEDYVNVAHLKFDNQRRLVYADRAGPSTYKYDGRYHWKLICD